MADSFLEEMSAMGMQQRKVRNWDFIEGVIFAENENYLTLARFVDEAPYVSDTHSWTFITNRSGNKEQDHLTASLFFRYEQDWFWCSRLLARDRFLRNFGASRTCAPTNTGSS